MKDDADKKKVVIKFINILITYLLLSAPLKVICANNHNHFMNVRVQLQIKRLSKINH